MRATPQKGRNVLGTHFERVFNHLAKDEALHVDGMDIFYIIVERTLAPLSIKEMVVLVSSWLINETDFRIYMLHVTRGRL
jgi:hypothetical protein